MRADGDEHGLVALLEQLLHGHVDAEAEVVPDLDAERLDALDLGAQHLARQAVVGDADRGHAAGLGQRLEDGAVDALEPEVVGAGQAGRPGADDGDARLARQLAQAIDLGLAVGDEALERADGDRLVDRAAAAGVLAGTHADAADGGRHGAALAHGLGRALDLVDAQLLDVGRDVDAGGAGGHARRDDGAGVGAARDRLAWRRRRPRRPSRFCSSDSSTA